jgi:hypothetical protein
MNVTHQSLAAAVRKARDKAKEVLDDLQRRGHPDTGYSSSVYLSLVTLQKRLLAVDPPPPPIERFVPELEQLARACEGKLATLKPLIDEALGLARRK